MPPSGRFLNWDNVSFTPDNSTVPIPIQGVTDVQYDPRVRFVEGAGDTDIGPSSKNVSETNPQFTVEFEHLSALMSLTEGMIGTFTATHLDADNGIGTGAMVYTAHPAVVGNLPRGGRFRAYGTSRMTIETKTPDGRTSPVSVAVNA
jgi:hypothetical protein